MSPKNDTFMSGSLDHTVRLWDLRTNICQVPHTSNRVGGFRALSLDSCGDGHAAGRLGGWVAGWQGLMRVRGRPSVAYDEQGLVFAVAMEGGAVKLFDVRSYEKVKKKRGPCCRFERGTSG